MTGARVLLPGSTFSVQEIREASIRLCRLLELGATCEESNDCVKRPTMFVGGLEWGGGFCVPHGEKKLADARQGAYVVRFSHDKET